MALGEGRYLGVGSVAAGCKSQASYKVVTSHRWSVLALDDFHARESRLAQI